MALLDAPVYNEKKENRKRNLAVGSFTLFGLLVVLTVVGFLSGHGWLFSNLGYEHRADRFFTDLEDKDYAAAYGVYNNDSDWQQHPQKYADYPLAKFTEDWTTYSPVHGPITAHHVDASHSDGSGMFGTGIIVAVNVNHFKEVFVYIVRSDKTMTWPAPHELSRY